MYDVIALQIIESCQRFVDKNFHFIILSFKDKVAVIYKARFM